MTTIDRWTVELQNIQESLVYLVPGKELAQTLVAQAGIPDTFIDFGEPPYVRIRRIMVEAGKRNMLAALLGVVTGWYPENDDLAAAKAAWEAGQDGADRTSAAERLRKAARKIPDPVAVAKVTRQGEIVTDVEVDVKIPQEEEDVAIQESVEVPVIEEITESPVDVSEGEVGVPYSDELQPGDWYSAQKTLVDMEYRLGLLEEKMRDLDAWLQLLSGYSTPKGR